MRFRSRSLLVQLAGSCATTVVPIWRIGGGRLSDSATSRPTQTRICWTISSPWPPTSWSAVRRQRRLTTAVVSTRSPTPTRWRAPRAQRLIRLSQPILRRSWQARRCERDGLGMSLHLASMIKRQLLIYQTQTAPLAARLPEAMCQCGSPAKVAIRSSTHRRPCSWSAHQPPLRPLLGQWASGSMQHRPRLPLHTVARL